MQSRWDTLVTQALKAQQATAACTQYAENMLLEFAAELAVIAQDIAVSDMAQQQQLLQQPLQPGSEVVPLNDSAQVPAVRLSPGTARLDFSLLIRAFLILGGELDGLEC